MSNYDAVDTLDYDYDALGQCSCH